MKPCKLLFTDLDGTLIDTISGGTFPAGIWDMKIRFEVLDKIMELHPLAILIVTNQGGIESGFVDKRNFEFKMEYLCRSIREYTGIMVEYSYCPVNDKNNPYRKPHIGMLSSLFRRAATLFRHENIILKECLMIGDASGKEGQFSDSDRKAAENFGIAYMDVDDFLND